MANPAGAFDALGDPTRRAVLEQLREHPRAVGEIAARLPVSRPAVSRHLRVLTDAGLVRATAVGRTRLYSVAPSGLHDLQRWLNTFWDDVLAGLAADVETRPAQTTPAQTTPARTTPAQATPLEATLVERPPTETMPAEERKQR